ncbi:MAG: DUF418 domain-containing protein [Isosphaeraceae bacterium]|nr:DUF418 domain-containing protein [Isosphaeraceae bacterium]
MSTEDRPPEPTPDLEAEGSVESMDHGSADEIVTGVEPVDSEPPPPPEPVTPSDRVDSVDVLRGVALMGILAMNIVSFGWPFSVYENPIARPGADEFDIILWSFNHLVFDTKMMSIFSMLFGAGLVLMDGRAEARGSKIKGVYFRRTFWLLVIGLIHGYLVWEGDILVDYALCGFLLYFFRKRSARTLLILGTILVTIAIPLLFLFREVVHMGQSMATEVESELRLDIPQSEFRLFVFDKISGLRGGEKQRDEKFQEEIRTFRGDYWGIVVHRAPQLLGMQLFAFPFFLWWAVGGRMLIGMGLMKLGVLSARCSWKFYAWMTAIGYGVGLPLIAFDTYELIEYQWSMLRYGLEGGMLLNLVGGLIVVCGHIGLVMMICKGGLLSGLTRRLAAAGRMALSNYLFDSIFCTLLFYGYGAGLFGTWSRLQLYGLTIAIWIFQLWFSPIWLSRFRYGPAEWVWRSLTYWRFQPMLVRARADAVVASVTEPTAEVELGESRTEDPRTPEER